MSFPLFTSMYLSPDAEPTAGSEPASTSPPSGDPPAAAPASEPAAAAPTSLAAARAASKAAPAAAESTPEDAPMPWLKDGKVLDGRYDRDDHKFTPEYVNENPHVRALLDSHFETNRQLSALKNGHFERLAPKDDVIASLDLSLTEDGKLNKGAADLLLGKPVTPKMLDMIAEMVGEIGSVRTSQFETWTKSVDERHGEDAYRNSFQWAASADSGITDEELAEIDDALHSKTLRDATIDMLHERYMNAVLTGKYQPGAPQAPIKEEERLEASNSAGGGVGGEGVFETEEECYASMPNEQLEPEAHKKWMKKVERSPAIRKAMMTRMGR